jgi:hypothetical protein
MSGVWQPPVPVQARVVLLRHQLENHGWRLAEDGDSLVITPANGQRLAGPLPPLTHAPVRPGGRREWWQWATPSGLIPICPGNQLDHAGRLIVATLLKHTH